LSIQNRRSKTRNSAWKQEGNRIRSAFATYVKKSGFQLLPLTEHEKLNEDIVSAVTSAEREK